MVIKQSNNSIGTSATVEFPAILEFCPGLGCVFGGTVEIVDETGIKICLFIKLTGKLIFGLCKTVKLEFETKEFA